MTSFEDWQATNAAYLAAALEWLRLRLALRAEELSPPVPPPTAANPVKPSTRPGLFTRSSAPPAAGVPLLPAPAPAPERIDQASVDQAAAALAAFDAGETVPALILLARRFGLSGFERELLLLCAGMELDPRIAALCARAQNDRERPHPTFALALSLSSAPAWEALSPERPLRRLRLIEVDQLGSTPLTASALRVDERILSFIKGLNYLEPRLSPLMAAVPPCTTSELPGSQRRVAQELIARLRAPLPPHGLPAIRLTGTDRAGYAQTAAAVSGELGLELLRVSADMLPAAPAELEAFARLWQRESLLLPVALYIAAADVDRAHDTDGAPNRVTRLLRRLDTLVFVEASDAIAATFDGTWEVEVQRASATEQASAWHDALGNGSEAIAAKLAGQFDLNIREIEAIAERSNIFPEAERAQRLWQGCLSKTRPLLDALAQKLDVKASWDDLVVPKYELSLLQGIAAQVAARARVYDEWGFRERMSRGFGISALFAGDSGTGKTMAAEVLANALQLDLYRIDLSAVVSKYIGETEKNLSKVFDAAEQGGAILFFDEADALFGKRSEVKDAHDRYANVEINYLLQRMEAFGGLAILASNMKSALDPAFVRRLRFIVSFTYPAPSERQLIWQRAFPSAVPQRPLDYARLAKFNLTGGNIHNIALQAAFLAAGASTEVSMPIVLEAVRMELRKLERPINEAELRWDNAPGAAA